MKENIIKEKSYSFAIRIINLYKYLNKNQKDNILARQILRCGTSVGANIEEAIGGSSKRIL
jgi:four helix bundle protein